MKLLQGLAVKRETLLLIVRREWAADIRAFLPVKTKPMQILDHRRDKIEMPSCRIEVVVAQNQFSPGRPGAFLRDPKRTRMTEVKIPGGRGREPPPV